MTKARVSEAERLRRHNDELKLALAENVTVIEARRRLAIRRWKAVAEARERRLRCGTADVENPPAPGLPETPSAFAQPKRQQFWWERD